MARKILVADLLCGAGGSSTGCARALAELGLDMDLVCVNHWPTAIETHKRNHPEARHYVQDIASVRPHLLVPEGRLDLLMASPTCTHHSVARGGKPTSDQQRSDPWHIITWLTELRVKRIIIENVWEFTSWGPVDPRTGKPIKARRGEYFRQWIATLQGLGFVVEWRKLNAADYGDATTRQRFILMGRSDGKPISWPMPTHRKREDGTLALFPGVLPWKPAREIIDWSIRGRSIFDRKKPLAPKTLQRIWAGAVKFGWPAPFLVILRNHMAAQGIDGPVPTIAALGGHIGLAQPVIVSTRQHTGGPAPRGQDDPLPTMTATDSRIAVAEPIILSQHSTGSARSTHDPLPTVTTGGAGTEDHPGCARPSIIEPVIMNGRRGNKAKAASTDPLPTLDTKGGVWLAEPFVTTVAHGNSDGDATADSRRVHSTEDPLGTLHAGGGKFGIAEPFVLSRQGEGAPRPVSEPTPTQVAKHSHVLVAPYYGSGSGETCKSAEEPLDTVTAKARFGMVVPITHADGSQRARDVDTDPLPTLTTANRGELAFITAQHGEREGQAPRVHDVDRPEPFLDETMLLAPIRWKKPRMVFVCSMTDLFADFVADEWIDKVFAVMALAPQHTFQVLTKRPERMKAYCTQLDNEPVRDTVRRIVAAWPGNAPIPSEITFPLSNVWLGTSCEDQTTADERIPLLLDTPAAIRFVSAEPLLGPIDLTNMPAGNLSREECGAENCCGGQLHQNALDNRSVWCDAPVDSEAVIANSLDWLIVGGESGRHARPMHPAWARSLCDQCQAAGVPFFFKQWGEHEPNEFARIGKDGEVWRRTPAGKEHWFFDELGKAAADVPPVRMSKVGKKAAGALLDGREWRQFPEVQS